MITGKVNVIEVSVFSNTYHNPVHSGLLERGILE